MAAAFSASNCLSLASIIAILCDVPLVAASRAVHVTKRREHLRFLPAVPARLQQTDRGWTTVVQCPFPVSGRPSLIPILVEGCLLCVCNCDLPTAKELVMRQDEGLLCLLQYWQSVNRSSTIPSCVADEAVDLRSFIVSRLFDVIR